MSDLTPIGLAGERVLVTGATGFLGGRCVKRLASTCGVIATGRDRGRLSELASESVETLGLDLSSSSAAERLAAVRPSAILHCAALSSPWGDLPGFYSANVVGTRSVLSAVATLRVPLVHVSTPALYINGTDRLDVTEDEPLPDRFVNNYVLTKRQAEHDVLAWAEAEGNPVAILRPQGITGRGDSAIAPRLLRVARRGVFPLADGGRSLVDLTHVENVVDAAVLALGETLDGAWKGAEVFNISNGDPRPSRELVRAFLDARPPGGRRVRLVSVPRRGLTAAAVAAETVARLGRFEPPITRYSVDLMGVSRTLNIGKARQRLGFDPSAHSLDQAFVDFFEPAAES